ncbi:MAG: beta strand repeat-containing protein, partial [Bacteroidota bacterium]
MIDSYGDGWNGATMTLNVNGSPYLVFGSTFTTGLNQTITACLPENAAYTLVWTSGGSFSTEVGVSIDVTGNANYTKASGTGTVGSTLTTGTSCPPGCTGTPNGGITSATGSAVCNGTTVTFTNTGYTFGTGISYSWEFSTDGTNFSAIAGATNGAAYSAAITAAGYYRLAVTCANSNTTSYSNNVQVTLNAPLDCYCTPTTTYGCTDGDVSARVILNTLDNNSGTGCPSGTAGYSNYTTDPALTTTLLPSTTYSCVVYAGQYAEGYAAWIDYNDNGIFETTERIGYSNGTVAGSGQVGVLGSSAAFPVVIDCNPPVGPHRMRVRAMYATTGINVTPCTNNFYGEIEDYTITIAAPPVCPSPGALTVSATTYNSVSLTWPLGCSTATNYDFEYGPTGFTPGTGTVLTNVAATIDGATNTGSYTITGLAANTTYQVYYRANCGAETSAWSFPASYSTPVAPPTISSVDPVQACPGSTVTVTGTDFVNITSVTVGGVAASYTVASATSISVVVPMTVAAGLVSVDVTNAGGTAQGGLLTFAAASTSISGSSAICAGSSATLTASGSGTFSWMNYPCVYSIELEDTFGDGWNGGTVDVVVDGVVVLDNLTVGSGYGPAVSNFAVSGTNVSIVYTAGSWSGENHYTVYAGPDATGAVLFASTVGATPPATQAISTTGCEGVSMGSGSSISATTGGAYGVTLTDANGCQASASTTLTVNPVPTASTATAATVCYGSTVTLSATETTGLAGVTFEWFDIAATSVGTGASYTTNPVYADDYYYVVASTATCSSAPAFTGVVVSALSGVQLTAINITCNGAANGSFSQTQVCGTAPFSYSVVAPGNPAGTYGALPTNLAAGTYSVYVQDANNNVTLPVELVITEPAALTAVTTTNAAVCAGVTEGIVTATLANVTSSLSIGDNLEGDGFAPATYTANINLPAGATVVSANIIFTDVTSQYMGEAQWALSGAATTSAAGFPSTGWGLQTIDFTTAIPVTSGGALTLTLTDTYDDAGIDFTIANATVEVTYTSPNTIAWFADAAATQLIGLGTSLDVVGTTVAAEPATSGTYTVYAAQYDGTCYGPVTAATLEVGAPLAVDITVPAGCTYSVGLVDSYGDGWNGGSLTVLVDGVAVLSGLTVANGFGPEFHNFSVTPGQTIVMNYTAGQWAGENSYVVYDGADGVGAVIYTSTAAPAATASITNSCSGGTICPGANQTLTANITGGGAPYVYSWSTG